MARWKRNHDKHTSVEEAKQNILRGGVAGGYTTTRQLMSKSQMGVLAFPDYDFKKPQGAAFAVAKIVHDLEGDGLVRYWSETYLHRWGYYVTARGVAAVEPKAELR